MSLFTVTRKADGIEVYRYSAPAPIEWSGLEFATHDHVAQPDAPPPGAPPPPEPQTWERTEFLRRFTSVERIMAKRKRATDAVLDDFWTLLESSPEVHSIDTDLRLGLGYLVMIGVLTTERMRVILGDAQ